LELKVVAEGIEDDLQEKMLLELGCESGQGYLYAKAMDIPSTLKFLKSL
jgi:EAL domain-containing protein (putative c-di-GMP-specific phosphodiesterase class I)